MKTRTVPTNGLRRNEAGAEEILLFYDRRLGHVRGESRGLRNGTKSEENAPKSRRLKMKKRREREENKVAH